MRRRQETLELPSDFPMQLLAAEFALENDASSESVDTLVNLYQQAIEYYEHQGDSRFLDFQARMHRMFLRPDIHQGLSRLAQPPSPSLPPPSPVHTSSPASVELSAVAPMKQGRKTEFLLEAQKKNTTLACRNVKKDVADQNSTLRRRLARRREGRVSVDFDKVGRGDESPLCQSARSIHGRTPSLQVYTESDVSGGMPKYSGPDPMEEMAIRLEEAIEKIYEERTTTETEIRLNYEKQIAEMEKGMNGSKIVQQVIATMRTSMAKDLSLLHKAMEERCKVETLRIRGEYSA